MKLYGLILLFLIVIMIFTETKGTQENFGLWSDISNAVSSAGKAIHNTIVLGEGSAGVISTSVDFVGKAKKSLQYSKTNIPSAIEQANNVHDYAQNMKQRVFNCSSMAKGFLGTPPSIQTPDDCSKIISKIDRAKCHLKNGGTHTKNVYKIGQHISTIHKNFKANYEKHKESPECAKEYAALQARIAAQGEDSVTARETIDLMTRCNTCLNHHSAGLAKPMDASAFVNITNNTKQTITTFPPASPTINVLTKMTSQLEL